MKNHISNLVSLILALTILWSFPIPANAQESTPEIQKDVVAVGNNSGSFDVGQLHTWIIRSTIPEGIRNAQVYEISDTLDHRLDYDIGSMVVLMRTKDGIEIHLEQDTHYLLTEETLRQEGQSMTRIQLSLTEMGMLFVAENLGEGKQEPELRASFRASINTKSAMGSTIPGNAHLYYRNSVGVEYSSDSDIPEVHTGGIHLVSTDAQGNGMKGTTFMIAREATQAELETQSLIKEVLEVDGKDIAVVYRYFYSSDGMDRGKVDMVTTDETGAATIYGLSYGSYYLLEIQGPEGYDIPQEPIPVQINETSHLTAKDGWSDRDGQIVDHTLRIVHSKFVIPYTGGTGPQQITAIGALLLASAGFLLLVNRKKRL